MSSLHNDEFKLDEFQLIEKYFSVNPRNRSDVVVGIGDDSALVNVPKGYHLALSMDTLVKDIHFSDNTSAFDVAYKALAVNLSDLAAMGAEPAWIILSLTMPEFNQNWLSEFSNGLFYLAKQFNLQLIGGDTTRGPLSVTIQAHGFIPAYQGLRRDGAKVGDKIYVSGTLGDAGLGLAVQLQQFNISENDKFFVLNRLNQPTPRVQLGIFLRDIATSAIDISDGLLADLNHILNKSKVGATIHAKDLPLSSALLNLPSEDAYNLALTAGDDYELCFTIPEENEEKLILRLKDLKLNCCCIGSIEDQLGLRISGPPLNIKNLGFKHF